MDDDISMKIFTQKMKFIYGIAIPVLVINGSELRIPSIYVLFTHYVYVILMVISLHSILCSSFEIENLQANHP